MCFSRITAGLADFENENEHLFSRVLRDSISRYVGWSVGPLVCGHFVLY